MRTLIAQISQTMSFSTMAELAAALPSTSSPSPWTCAPTLQTSGIGLRPQPSTMEEFVMAYAEWQRYYAIDTNIAGVPPTIPTISQSTPQFSIHQSAPTPSSPSSSTSTPPTIKIPASLMRRGQQQQPSFFRPARASTSQVPIPTLTGKIGKLIAAKPEMYNGTKEKFNQWWRTMTFYLLGFESPPSDFQKMMIVISYMRGGNAAGRFVDLYALEHQPGEYTFDEFTNILIETFLPKELKREAEQKLMTLKQGQKDTVTDFFIKLKQLTIEAGYDTRNQARLLICITCDGIQNEVIEYVERSNLDLFNLESLDKWEKVLTRAETVLTEITDRKKHGGHQTFTRNWFGNKMVEKTSTSTAPAQPTPKVKIHPNQVGNFGAQGGVPMDIGKA